VLSKYYEVGEGESTLFSPKVKGQLDAYFAVARLLAPMRTAIEEERRGSISPSGWTSFLFSHRMKLTGRESRNESQRLTERVLWPGVCVRSSGQWPLFRGSIRMDQFSQRHAPARMNPDGITRSRSRPRERTGLEPRRRVVSVRGKRFVIYIRWKLVPHFSSSVSSTCDLAVPRSEIRLSRKATSSKYESGNRFRWINGITIFNRASEM